MKKIVLTGGGTAGHVTPNIALLPRLKEAGYQVEYIGSYRGMEKQLIENVNIPYHGISSGKLRRYFSLKNISDILRVLRGYYESLHLLRKMRPALVFSKGGFVSVPVVLAAKTLHIPAIIHESDITPGLANRIALRGASKVCCNFPETLPYLPSSKAVLTGSPIRQELLSGDIERARAFTGFSDKKAVLLIMGGSLGSVFINRAVRESLDHLLPHYQIIHLCGKGNLDPSLDKCEGYRQYEYISEELPDLFALADLIVSRAGANAICELLYLRKPNILIPLSASASRGDQILNARSFEKQGFSYVIEEEDCDSSALIKAISHVSEHKEDYLKAMDQSGQMDSIGRIVELIQEFAK